AMVRGVRIKDHWAEQRMFEQRALIAGCIIAVLTLTLIARLFVLQVVRHEYYADLSQGNRVRIEPIPAARGLILDRHGEVLASNQPAYQLELVPEEVPDLDKALYGLVALGLIPADDVDDVRRTVKSRRPFESVPIRLRMSEEDVATFAVRRFEFPGIDIKTRQTRLYPHKELAVHALGYVAAISEQDLERIDRQAYSGTTLIGKLGVEAAYEKELHGTNGFREVLVNAQGRSVQRQGALIPDLREQAPIPGQDLILAMDFGVQRTAEEALGDRRGAVVALDPMNGDVIALVSRPGFDPNMFGRGLTRAEYAALQNDINTPLFNRALRGTYPPGSTVKPVMALAGLAHGIDPHKTRHCGGVFRLPGSSRAFREGRGGVHGPVNLERSISVSCDVYYYALADTLGIDYIASFLAPFGFGSVTGIDIGGEKAGILPSREWKRRAFRRPEDKVWFPGETVNIGIGQGYMLVTPLQLAHVTATIASRGKAYKPRLVTGMRDPKTGVIKRIPPVLSDEVKNIPPDHWQIVFNGMIGTMTRGTARASAAGAPYTIAGKTGTAQVFSVGQNERYDEKTVAERLRDHSWFVAFAPAEAPRIAVAVLVENGGFGATAAAPIARKVMDAYLLGPGGKLKEPVQQPDASPKDVT
ncbi:MAG TPA: penicillin-binding protein 2, partial [Steroidobacteraceae bacterium]